MRIEQLFPSKYVAALDLGGQDVSVTIKSMTIERMGNPPQEKPVLRFKGASKSFVLNKVNGVQIAALHGPETDDWVGKRITLYPTRVKAYGKVHDVIRIRPHIPPPVNGNGNGNSSPPVSQEAKEAGLDDLEEVQQAAGSAIAEEVADQADNDNPFLDEKA